MRLVLLVCFSILIYSCSQSNGSKAEQPTAENTSSAVSQKTAKPENDSFNITQSGKKVEKAEKGITVVNHDGWTQKQMDFQIGYCESMMGSIEEVDAYNFCTCFLDKVQFYYEPIYVRDSYSDQAKWNQECYESAQI